jgi:uncharacterized protein (TIGR02594 family)
VRHMQASAYSLALRYVGLEELQEKGQHHPFIQWCHESCGLGLDQPDEVPWCSSFVNRIAWELRLPRSKSARARSWLTVGTPITLTDAEPGFDVVVLKRGGENEPGPEVLLAQGHVGLFAGLEGEKVLVLGGNQGDMVSIAPFRRDRVLGVRRLM